MGMSASAELVYTGPFLPPNQQCQSSEGKSEYVLCVTYKKEKGFIACLLLFCLSLSVFVCLSLSFSLSVLVVIFTGLASFIGSKDDESGDVNWSCQTCKAPVKSSPPTNPTFYRPDALPVSQPTFSRH